MAGRIQELDSTTSTGTSGKKNVDELLRKGPEFTQNTPIDEYFQKLDDTLLSKLETRDVNKLYTLVSCQNKEEFSIYLIEKLLELQSILMTNPVPVVEQDISEQENRNLMPISLNDMRLLDLLINLIVVHSIDRYLPYGFGIPLEQRNLSKLQDNKNNNQDQSKIFRNYKLNKTENTHILEQGLYKLIKGLFKTPNAQPKSNVNSSTMLYEILLKGSGFSDILVGLLYLSTRDIKHLDTYEYLESLQSTYNLFEMYTTFYQSGLNLQFKQMVLEKLSTLTFRREEDGLYSLIEFILGLRETVDNEIEVSKFNKVNEIVCNKPKSIKNVEYFIKIFKQILKIFSENMNNDAMINAVNNIITEFYFKNKKIVIDFLFKQIYFKMFNLKKLNYSVKQTNDLFNILICLSRQSSNEIIVELIENYNEYDFFFVIWRYALFIYMNNNRNLNFDQQYYTILINLMKTYMEIGEKYYVLNYIILNFNTNKDKDWGKLIIDLESKLLRVSIEENVSDVLLAKDFMSQSNDIELLQKSLIQQDSSINLFIEFLKKINDENVTKKIFLSVLNRWCRLKTLENDAEVEDYDNLLMLSDLKLLEKFNNEFKSDLINEPGEILDFIDSVLKLKDLNENSVHSTARDDVDSDDEDEDDEEESEEDIDNHSDSNPLSIILQLLSTIITTNGQLLKYRKSLESIQSQLKASYSNDLQSQTIVQRINDEVLNINDSTKGSNVDLDSDSPEAALEEDRKILKRAIVNISDPLVPIRAQGLVMLRELLLKKSNVIDYKFVLDLHLLQLNDKDPFIYLNVIKGLTFICQFDSQSLKYLIELYDNTNKKTPMDEVLKIGEVLVNYVQLANQMFEGEISHNLIQVCLRKINVSKENLTNIGGSVDNRLRMSSMSILGVILQTNASALYDSEISDILDCCFGILKFESSHEATFRSEGDANTKKEHQQKQKEIEDTSKLMRRSAIHTIHDLLYHSGFERFPSQYSGSNLMNLLKYTRSQEHDFLTTELIDKLINLIDEIIKDALSIKEFDDSLINKLKIVNT